MPHTIHIPDGFWLCHWHHIYGNINHAEGLRSDSEEPVIDADGDKLCQKCAATYWREREKARRNRLPGSHNGEID